MQFNVAFSLLLSIFFINCIILVKSFDSNVNENLTENHTDNPNKNEIEIINTFRLPNNTKPLNYDLQISTNIHRNILDFFGVVNIHLIVINHTNSIVIHSHNLNIEKITLIDLSENRIIENVESDYDETKSFLRIFSKVEPLKLITGKEYRLLVSYNGTLSRGALGFYKSSYINSKNETIWIASTQFEPIYARNAFPCYDEPKFKAHFTITLIHGGNYSAVSNMPTDGEPIESADGNLITKFQQTPPMSTYNLAFAISNFEYISDQMENITQRIFYNPNSKNKGKFALETAIKTLHVLQEYFNVSYPLAKLDHFSVGSSYGGAMENWGLITYKKDVLLPNSRTKPIDMKTAIVIAHEISHQWFGNLVTPKWWTYIWLNEGLATHYGHKAVQMIYPEWNTDGYTMETVLDYIWYDDVNNPITHYVERGNAILDSFSGATYYKGAFILKMFEHALTEDTFKKGISLYLNKFQYSTAIEDDFFDTLQEVAISDSIPYLKEDGIIKKAMKTWTQQKYHPIVTVKRNYENATISLNQKIFPNDINKKHFWYIPITIATEKEPNFDYTALDLIFPNVENITIDLASLKKELHPDEWLILNKKQIGLYHVNYDRKNWKLLIQALRKNPKSIHPFNKAQLLRDSGMLFLQNQLNFSIFFDLLTYLKYEDEDLPWNTATTILGKILGAFEYTEIHELFKQFLRILIRNKFKITKFENYTTAIDEVVSLNIFKLSCLIDLEECLEYASSKYDAIFNGTTTISDNLKNIFFCQGIKGKTNEVSLELLLDELDRTKKGAERQRILECMASSNNQNFIKDFLESLLNSNINLNSQEKRTVIDSVSENSLGISILLQFLKNNHKELMCNNKIHLKDSISFLRYQVQSPKEKQLYSELLKEVSHLDIMEDDDFSTDNYFEFPNKDLDDITLWLKSYIGSNISNKSNENVENIHENLIETSNDEK